MLVPRWNEANNPRQRQEIDNTTARKKGGPKLRIADEAFRVGPPLVSSGCLAASIGFAGETGPAKMGPAS